jgi:hypothetical protein
MFMYYATICSHVSSIYTPDKVYMGQIGVCNKTVYYMASIALVQYSQSD